MESLLDKCSSNKVSTTTDRTGPVRRQPGKDIKKLLELRAWSRKGTTAGHRRSPTIEGMPEKSGSADRPKLRGVSIDWGGVMTNPILETVNAWIEAEGIDRASYTAVMRPWVSQAYDPDGAGNPIHALERGECTNEEFERLLADQLVLVGGGPVPADGLLTRMFAATLPDGRMQAIVGGARRAGGVWGGGGGLWSVAGGGADRDPPCSPTRGAATTTRGTCSLSCSTPW